MKNTIGQERKLKTIVTITLSGVLIAFIYNLFADFGKPIAFLNGLFIGSIGGLSVSFIELYAFNPHKRRWNFMAIVGLKTLIYFSLFFVLIITVMGFNESVYYGEGFWEHIRSERFQTFLYEEDFIIILIYSLLGVAIVIFTRQMGRKMGQGVLFNFIIGKYHEPKEEERIFMFLDITSSTSTAEKLGDIQYYNFLNDFFFDITKCILAASGEIYRYVGDQVVITWDTREGLKNANCIRTHFYIKDEIERLKEKYLEKYGFVPRFTSSFHGGKVIRGEIGDVKSQIVFSGEILYVTSLIEKKCGELGQPILLSADVMQRIPLPVIYQMKLAGQLPLDGRTLDLYTIEELELATA